MLTHEYPQRPELRLEALREALAGAPLLLETLVRVRERAIRRHGLEGSPRHPAAETGRSRRPARRSRPTS